MPIGITWENWFFSWDLKRFQLLRKSALKHWGYIYFCLPKVLLHFFHDLLNLSYLPCTIYQSYLEISYSSPWFCKLFRWPTGLQLLSLLESCKGIYGSCADLKIPNTHFIKSAWDSAQMLDGRVINGRWKMGLKYANIEGCPQTLDNQTYSSPFTNICFSRI